MKEHSTQLMTFDPGLREAGIAVFDDNRLVHTQAVYADFDPNAARETQWADMMWTMRDLLDQYRPAVFAFEGMSTRKGKESAHANIIELSVISGLCAGVAAAAYESEFVCVPANLWTHGRKKAVNHAIIQRILDEEELAVLDVAAANTKKSNVKEIMDAIGIGLHCLKRWK